MSLRLKAKSFVYPVPRPEAARPGVLRRGYPDLGTQTGVPKLVRQTQIGYPEPRLGIPRPGVPRPGELRPEHPDWSN